MVGYFYADLIFYAFLQSGHCVQSVTALIQYYTAVWVDYCSVVRVSASYSTVSHLNVHPQSLGRTLKLLLKFTRFSGVI